MRKLALLSVAVAAIGLAGVAFADTMEETFGSTVLITNDKGETSKVWYKDDGTFTSEGPKGEKGSGKWVVKGNQYCQIPNLPATAPKDTPAPKEACTEYQGNHKAGDKWSQKGTDGTVVTVEIKKGM